MFKLKELLNPLFNKIFIVSKTCPFCNAKHNAQKLLCPKCSRIIKMYNQQEFCRICGKIIAKKHSSSEPIICGPCQKEKPPFTVARGVAVYHDLLKENIYKFKYHGCRSLGPIMAELMIEKILSSPEFISIDAIIPVPISREKLIKRRYNHTELLANEIGRLLNIPVYGEAIVRVTDFSSQSKLNRRERALNIKGAFQTDIGYNFLNQKVLLVDDIVTTGATIFECSKLLKINGAKDVFVISLVTGRTNF